MSRERRRGLRLVAGLLAIVAVVGFLARTFLRDDVHVSRLAIARQEKQSASELDDSDTGSIATRWTESVLMHRSDPELDVDLSGAGVLHVHVHDAASGRPVPGATCVVYAERHGEHQYGVLKTDADGRATIGQLPENTILVHVLRNPPYASGYGGLWLKNGATRDLDIALTGGGLVVGRAIDDLHHPVADADVFLASQRWLPDMPRNAEPELVTRTDADGRFEVPCVVSDPEIVWIKDGEMRPEYWGDVEVLVKSGLGSGNARSEVRDARRVDLGDVLVPRERTYAGHVTDARGTPVNGAVVELEEYGTSEVRRTLPPREGVAFDASTPDRVLTMEDGSFEIRCGAARKQAVVTTREGFLQSYGLPDLGPGSRTEDLRFVIDGHAIVEIELVNEQGQRVLYAAHEMQALLDDPWMPAFYDGRYLDVVLALDGGHEIREQVVADQDGLFRMQIPAEPDVKRRVRLSLGGYQPIDEDIGVRSMRVERWRFTLHALPSMRVHVRVAEQPAGAPSHQPIVIQACLLDPSEFARYFPWEGYQHCCGQGSTWHGVLSDTAKVITLPVMAPERYWIHARVPAGHPVGDSGSWCLWEAHVGPFAADGEVHEIDVPAIPMDLERERLEKERAEAGPASEESDNDATAPEPDESSRSAASALQENRASQHENRTASRTRHSILVTVGGAIQSYPFASVRAWVTRTGAEWDDPSSVELEESLPRADGTRRFSGEVRGEGEFEVVVHSLLLQPLSRTFTVTDRAELQRVSLISAR